MGGSGSFDDMRWYRFRSLPRPPRDPATPDRTRAQLFAALTAAHASLDGAVDARLGLGWWRAPDGAVRVALGAAPVLPLVIGGDPDDGSGAPVLYPPGSRVEPLGPEEVDGELGAFPHWVACGGQADALWTAGLRRDTDRDPIRGGFEDYAIHLPHPFAWLVIASPVDAGALEREITGLEARFPAMRLKISSEKDRVELERSERRYRDLVRARAAGSWDIRIAAGGRTPGEARSTAAVLCSASEFDDVPFVLVPDADTTDLGSCLSAPRTLRGGATTPFRAGSEVLLAAAPTPSEELPGIRLVDTHTFDLTVEGDSGPGWSLGTILDRAEQPAGPYRIARASLNRHAFVCGATGSGKSQTVRSLLEALASGPAPVPWLAVEPAKSEYARMAGRLGPGAVTVIRPGDPDAVPACLNPLEPEPGFPLQAHADLVRALFLAAFEVTEPFPQVLGRALTEVYAESGWDLLTGEPRPAHAPRLRRTDTPQPARPRYPGLRDLQGAARRVVEQIGYGPEVAANVRGFVDVRIGSLRSGTPGRFFDGGHPLDVAGLLRRNVVLELDGVTNDADKAFVIGVVLIRIVEHLRVHPQARPGLRHVLVVEEAHRLLKNVTEGPAAGAIELFASLIAEIRAYGEGVAVVEQIPSKILPDVVKNTAVKIVHRLPAAEDRETVGATINLSPTDSELVVALPPGRAAAANDGMDRPVLVAFPLGEERESDHGVRRDPPLARTRSPFCPASCKTRPCTARRLNDADHHAYTPVLVVWVEAVTMCLLLGLRTPAPSRRTMTELVDVPSEDLHCALLHAAERAVDARRPLLRGWVDAHGFTERLLGEIGGLLGGGPLDDDWLRWTAGPRRFQQVEEDLHARPPADPFVPDDGWLALGVDLDAPTAGEALAQLRRLPAFQPGGDRVVAGDLDASALRDAVRDLGGGTSRRALETALAAAVGRSRLVELLLLHTAHLIATEA
ncbi:ATP-binding protein [Actinomycetospora sp. CA-084318]|uniref:ATP-binding protein n=1 Tax=Actinomycetospora sp. CA-084318 TaxID=3239892 RepID=UPI003D982B26